jgi:hypothetical protein
MDIEGLLDLCLRFSWLIALEALISRLVAGEASNLTWVGIILMRNIQETGEGWGAKGKVLVISVIFVCCQSRFGEGCNFPSFFNVPRIVKCHNLPLLNPKMPRAPMRYAGNI